MARPSLTKANIEVVYRHAGQYRCLKCGQIFQPMVQVGGRMPPGWWLCPNRCNWEITLERVKVESKRIGPPVSRHESLPEDLVERIKGFHRTLAEVDDFPVEEVIENFRCDMCPESEVVIWEGIAQRYQAGVKPRWGIRRKKKLFKKLLGDSTDENPLLAVRYSGD